MWALSLAQEVIGVRETLPKLSLTSGLMHFGLLRTRGVIRNNCHQGPKGANLPVKFVVRRDPGSDNWPLS